jgi:hypothetical protein
LDPNDLALKVTTIPTQTSVKYKQSGTVLENPIETLIKKSSKVYSDKISVPIDLIIPTHELVSFISL